MTDVKMLPKDFLAGMKELLGKEYDQYIKSYEEAWKPGLRVNTLKIMPEEFKNLSHLELTPVDWTEKGFYYEDRCGQCDRDRKGWQLEPFRAPGW